MAAKRVDETDVIDRSDDTPILSAALHASAKPAEAGNPEEKISLFWRVFGGTILSIVALVAITLFNNLNSTISELRGELHKQNEKLADLVKKDEFNTRQTSLYERLQGLQTQNNTQNATITSLRTEVDGYKERFAKLSADAEVMRKETAGLEVLRERLTAVEGAKKELAVLDGLKDKVVTLVADLKGQRDEYMKLRQDVDRNLMADQERKARRDEQYKEIEKAFKELQLAIQDCQVKMARLEGQTAPKPAPPKADAEKKGSAGNEE